jgi:hypothetical protein
MSGSDEFREFISAYPRLRDASASAQDIMMNYNLQEFAQQACFQCALADNDGKISIEQAWEGIQVLWSQLKSSRKSLYERGNPNKALQEKMRLWEEGTSFHDCLQIFGFRVGVLCALEAGGKIPPLEAYRRLKQYYSALKLAYRKHVSEQ